jgi:radical SAM protein with 4Fe4S-binding SPASM domain
LIAHDDGVLTGDSFFHLSAYGEPLPGLNLCCAGRVVCLIDPVGDVYACPFAIHEQFLAGNILRDGGFATVWRHSELFTQLRTPQTGGARAHDQPQCRVGEPTRRAGRSPADRDRTASSPPAHPPAAPWTRCPCHPWHTAATARSRTWACETNRSTRTFGAPFNTVQS